MMLSSINFFLLRYTTLSLTLILAHALFAQTGSVHEPVRYIGGVTIDPNVHDGRLRPPIGVHSHQTLRVNRTHPELADGFGWTYNHASSLAYWNNTFYQQYLSNPIDEHIAPGQTLITTSKDGMDWSKPVVVFPPYEPPTDTIMPDNSNGYMMHQRMGFYVAPEGRLLTLAFYGHAEDPFSGNGIGRVVREVYENGTFGPIYFIRYSSHTHWNETNTSYPFYRKSPDDGFVAACDALLADKLITRQWWDEDQGMDGFYPPIQAGEAFNFYRRKDGQIVGLWKRSIFALSTDNGTNFSTPVKSPTLIMAGGKQWGQATDDGRYAIAYNPIEMDEHRYPLIMISSDDGIVFDDMLVVQGEVPPRRFFGRWKDYGPCYVRGIVAGNGNPPGDNLWLTYSMNKEDMWVTRIPVPAVYTVQGPIEDNFQANTPGGRVDNWNIYDPTWAPVTIANHAGNHCLELQDQDPHDYARAVRVFQTGTSASLKFRIQAQQADHGLLEVDVNDRYGNRAVRLRFDTDGQIKVVQAGEYQALQKYEPSQWYQFEINIAAHPYGHFNLSINDKTVLENTALAVAVKSVERISFRTGPYRDLPNRKTNNELVHLPLEGADEPVENAIFCIDEVCLETE